MKIDKVYWEEDNRILLKYFICINSCTFELVNEILNEIHKDFPGVQDNEIELIYRDWFTLMLQMVFYIKFSISKDGFKPENIPELMDSEKFYSYIEEPL